MEILIARQPIFDRREQLFGYDLMLRRSGADSQDALIPEQLVADAFLGVGIDQVAEGHRAFVRVDRDMVLGGAAALLPAPRVVLQLDDTVRADSSVLEACNRLVWQGYRFAISAQNPGTMQEELLRLAEIVKVDISTTDTSSLDDLVSYLRTFHVRMLAQGVRHRHERDTCSALGFELFEGYRFMAPETLARRDLPIDQITVSRLLKMVRDPNVADGSIEDLVRRNVALSYKLLRMVNSTAGTGKHIWSIGHALRLLGREQVSRWLGLLLVTDRARTGVRAELMRLSLARARMCELLADASGVPRARGPLFLVGMVSVLDQLLEIPMEVLVDSMELAPDVRAALLDRTDFYGDVLSLIEAYEQGEWGEVDRLANSVGVNSGDLPPLYVDSLGWASEHRRRSDAPVAWPAVAGAR